jgi:hypothetical protein
MEAFIHKIDYNSVKDSKNLLKIAVKTENFTKHVETLTLKI